MEKSIVCGVDGSADSEAALTEAARLADRLGVRIVLANVVEYAHSPYVGVGGIGPVAGPQVPLTAVMEEEEHAAERLLDEMAAEAGLETAEKRVVSGMAAERLADLADEVDAELIVVGSRGRGALKAAFLGSVSASLIGVARCPVLVVPRGATESRARVQP
jgi:nucleotide-binding universal stress UspA family protein